MINTVIALLAEFFPDKLNAQEAEALAEKLKLATLPADYASAHTQVKNFIADIAKGR